MLGYTCLCENWLSVVYFLRADTHIYGSLWDCLCRICFYLATLFVIYVCEFCLHTNTMEVKEIIFFLVLTALKNDKILNSNIPFQEQCPHYSG